MYRMQIFFKKKQAQDLNYINKPISNIFLNILVFTKLFNHKTNFRMSVDP